ncbi:hypothetical protein LCGC14_2290530, partial [marine sediment metagenome]
DTYTKAGTTKAQQGAMATETANIVREYAEYINKRTITKEEVKPITEKTPPKAIEKATAKVEETKPVKEVTKPKPETYEGGAKKSIAVEELEEESFENISIYNKKKLADKVYEGHPHHKAALALKEETEQKKKDAKVLKEIKRDGWVKVEGVFTRFNEVTGEVEQMTIKEGTKTIKKSPKKVQEEYKKEAKVTEEAEYKDKEFKYLESVERIKKDRKTAAISRMNILVAKAGEEFPAVKEASDKFFAEIKEKEEGKEEAKVAEVKRKDKGKKEKVTKKKAETEKKSTDKKGRELDAEKYSLYNAILKGRDKEVAVESYQEWRKENDYTPASSDAIQKILDGKFGKGKVILKPVAEKLKKKADEEKSKLKKRIRKQVEKADKEIVKVKEGEQTKDERIESLINKMQQGKKLTKTEQTVVDAELIGVDEDIESIEKGQVKVKDSLEGIEESINDNKSLSILEREVVKSATIDNGKIASDEKAQTVLSKVSGRIANLIKSIRKQIKKIILAAVVAMSFGGVNYLSGQGITLNYTVSKSNTIELEEPQKGKKPGKSEIPLTLAFALGIAGRGRKGKRITNLWGRIS